MQESWLPLAYLQSSQIENGILALPFQNKGQWMPSKTKPVLASEAARMALSL